MTVPKLIGTGDLARVLGVTRETVRLRKNDGTFEEVSRGKYDLAKTVQAYIAYVDRDRQSKEIASAKHDVEVERARKLKLENDRVEGSSLDADEVKGVFAQSFILLRQRMSAMPARMDAELAGTSDRIEVRDILERECDGYLRDCAAELEKLAGFGTTDEPVEAAGKEDAGGMGKRK